MPKRNNRSDKINTRETTEMDGGPVEGRLNTDNAFSDKGLDNAEAARDAVKKTRSSR